MRSRRLPHQLRTFLVALALLGGLLAPSVAAAESAPTLVDGAPIAAGVVAAVEPLEASPADGLAAAPNAADALRRAGMATFRLMTPNADAVEVNYCYDCATYA